MVFLTNSFMSLEESFETFTGKEIKMFRFINLYKNLILHLHAYLKMSLTQKGEERLL